MRTRMRRLWMMSGASLSCLTGKGLSESRMIARYRQARVGRSTRPGDCQDRVKVRVQGHHDGVLSQRPREDLLIGGLTPVSYTHLRAHETDSYLVCRLLL